jgi:hypothetical protein
MTELTRVRIARESPPPAVRPSGQLDVVLMPWNTEAEVSDDGRTTYREKWESGSLVPDGDAVPVYGSHITTPRGLERGPLIGVARNITDGADGLHATLHLGTDEGRRIHELASMGVRAAVSIEADAGDTGPDDTGMVVRTAANPALLTGVATILPPQHPAYAGALVTAVRAAPTPPPPPPDEDEDDDTEPNTDPPAPDEDDEDEDEDKKMTVTDTPPVETTETGRAAVAELVRTEVARYGLQRSNKPAAHPLTRFSNELELLTAARAGSHADQAVIAREFHEAYQAHRELARAMVNQITPDNPGVLPPTWLSTIFGTIDSGRPGITAMGGPASAGDTGMDIYWPYYNGDLTTLVGIQAAEKTDIVSVKVSFLRGQATLKTFAGGSDVSYQLQRRSSPSYMAAYNRLLQTSYGLVTEITFDAALVAGAGATVVYDPSATDTDGAKFKAFLFAASAKVKKATGMPATAVLVSSDVWAKLGGMPWLQPPMYGTQNVPGTAAASTLKINVSGLDIVEAPGMAAGNLVVSNPEAARWFEDGPFLVTSEDVAKLGTDAAIWGMGITGITVPLGVVKASATTELATKFEKDQAKADKD